jgi:DNA-binding transcriptional LysR family regulator
MGKRIVLTQAGEQLLQHGERIMAEMEAARSSLANLGKWGRQRLRISASATACQYLLPSILRKFKDKFPQCMLSIVPADATKATEAARANQVDQAIILRPKHEDQLELHDMFTDELMFIVDPNHPWALAGKVTRDEIPRQNYIFHKKSSYTFRMIEDYFKQQEMTLNTVIEAGNMSAIKELVKLGLGVGILPVWIAREEIEEGSVVALSLGRRKLRRNWVLAHRRDKRLSLAEETFLTLCRTAGEQIVTTSVSLQSATT